MNRVNMYLGALSAAGFLIVFSSKTQAGLTDVITNQFGQPTPHQIVEHVYNDTFDVAGENFASPTIAVTRLNDNNDSTRLVGHDFSANAIARFSDYTQSYGTISGGSFKPAFDVSGKNYDVTGSGTVKIDSGDSFARSGNSGTQSSNASQNVDTRDHVVSYEVHGAQPDPQYLQFWEDLNDTPSLTRAGHTVSDYNDLVVQLTPADSNGGGNLVPLPPSVWTGAVVGFSMFIKQAAKRRRWGPFKK
jgi:hypothetical protein